MPPTPRSRGDPRRNRQPRARARSLGAAAPRRARGPDVRDRGRALLPAPSRSTKAARWPRRCRSALRAGPHAAAVAVRRARVPGRSRRAGIATSRPTGDPALAATLKDLAPTLPWLVEQAFASVLGPIAGQRVADRRAPSARVSRVRGGTRRRQRRELTRASSRDSLATGDEGRAFASRSARLPTRVDALAARIDALAARRPARSLRRNSGRRRRRPPQTV